MVKGKICSIFYTVQLFNDKYFSLLYYLCRVTFPQCHVRVSTVTDLSLLENLFKLKHRQEVHEPSERLSLIKLKRYIVCLQRYGIRNIEFITLMTR